LSVDATIRDELLDKVYASLKEAKEEVDKVNSADAMIFQTEKQMKEFGDKIPAEKKAPIETALAALKAAHQAQDLDAITQHLEALNTSWMAASQDMYNATQADGAATGATGNANGSNTESDQVTDVEFEEVKKS